jgi:hypothetical protein
MSAMGCPSCSQPMTRRAFMRKPVGDLDIDMCFACRAKNFVRSLTPPEIMQLRASVSQVRCSSCGAPRARAATTKGNPSAAPWSTCCSTACTKYWITDRRAR